MRAWVRAQREAHGTGTGPTGETPEQELRRLRREVATRRQEQALAKKWRCTSRKRRVEVRRDYSPSGRVSRAIMGRVLELSVTGFSAYCQRPDSWRAVSDDVVMAHVRIAFADQELRAAGLPTSTKRVARLMREAGLAARPRTRGRVGTTDSTSGDPIAPNRLARQCDVHGVALNQVWVGDITGIPTRDGFRSLSTVLDPGSRRGVGWAMRDTMEVDLVTSALRMWRGTRGSRCPA